LKKSINKIYERIENQRLMILENLDSISPEQLHYREKPDSWSRLQVVLHLVKAEQLTANYIQRKLRAKKNLKKAGIGSSIRMILLKLGLNMPVKYKAPKMVDVTDHKTDLSHLKYEWETVRKKIKDLIDQCDEKTLQKALFKHPRAGYLNFKQALEFIELHIAHHEKQIKRIEAASKSVLKIQ